MKKPHWLEKEELYNIIDETREKPKDGHCPRCDAMVRDEDRYCAHCGEKL